MSRLIEEAKRISISHLPSLPVVDWKKVGGEAPENIKVNYKGPKEALPYADIVVITWTSAEWSSLDHVFADSQTVRKPDDDSWRDNWYLYSKDAPESHFSELWGYFRMVKIKNKKVLLFKSEAHLAHPHYIKGLTEMVRHIIADVRPENIYSIGTAGGSSLKDILGDIVITNAGHIILEKEENDSVPYNNKTISCEWFPTAAALQKKVADKLLMPLNLVVTPAELNHLLEELHKKEPGSSSLNLKDLVNNPLNPDNLKSPDILPCKNIPLLTTDYYFIARGNDADQYSTLEMDDTVVGHEAGHKGVKYTFVRNISDPVVVSDTVTGQKISDEIREEWSSLIYQTCGLYTSFNGALTTWACIAEE